MQQDGYFSYGIVTGVIGNTIMILGNDGKIYRYNHISSLKLPVYSRVCFCLIHGKVTSFQVCKNTADTGKILSLSENDCRVITEKGEILLFQPEKNHSWKKNQKVKFDIVPPEKGDDFASAKNVSLFYDEIIDEKTKKNIYDILKSNFEFGRPYEINEIMDCLVRNNIKTANFGYRNDILFLEVFTEFIRFEYPSNRVILFDPCDTIKKYETAVNILRQIGYDSPTNLQQYVFRDRNFWEQKKVIIMGSTSSGKTVVPFVKFLADHEDSPNKIPKLLFVVNLRALASQIKKDMQKVFSYFRMADRNFKIAVSTSEHTSNDDDIKNGDTDAAVVMYEKLFIFLATVPNILDKYDYIIFDEAGTIESDERGAKIDIIFSHVCRNKKVNTFFLANTYDSWQQYIEKYGLYPFRYYSRPVRIDEFLKKKKSESDYAKYDYHAQNLCEDLPWKFDSLLFNICRDELTKKHKMIIFRFSQKDTVNMCVKIYKNLKNMIKVPSRSEQEAMIQAFYREYGVYRYELLSVYDTSEKLAALYNGITFHNASVPESIRSAVENELLGKPAVIRNGIRLVVATETLAYGLNGNVDTVIMTTMLKEGKKLPVTYNTYRNCIGRCGRLGYVDRGTAYTFLSRKFFGDTQKNIPSTIGFYSNTVHRGQEIISSFSRIVSHNNMDQLAFYLLNMMRNDVYTEDEIVDMVLSIPHNGQYKMEDVHSLIKQTLCFLIEEKMLKKYEKEDDDEKDKDELIQDDIERYTVTEKGKKYQAYVISVSNYVKIKELLPKCFCNGFYIADYLTALAELDGISNKSENFLMIPDLYKKQEISLAHMQFEGIKKLAEYVIPVMLKRGHISLELHKEILSSIKYATEKKLLKDSLYQTAVGIKIVMAAYLWMYGADVRTISKIEGFDDVTLLNIRRQIGEKMSYYTDIAGVSAIYAKIQDDVKKRFPYLSLSLFYGINPDWLEKYKIHEFNSVSDANFYRMLSEFFFRYQNIRNNTDMEDFRKEFRQLDQDQQNLLKQEGINI